MLQSFWKGDRLAVSGIDERTRHHAYDEGGDCQRGERESASSLRLQGRTECKLSCRPALADHSIFRNMLPVTHTRRFYTSTALLTQTVRDLTLKQHFRSQRRAHKVRKLVAEPDPNSTEHSIMIANQSVSPALFVIPGGSPRHMDPVKARVAAPRQITNFEQLQAISMASEAANRGPHLIPATIKGSRRRPHPGDVLYWVACLGGVCLLLLSATT
jgi:hypothetical protein